MGLESFIPEIWASSLLVQLRKIHVFAALANRDYEGDIRQVGDTVRINELSSVDVGDYTKTGTVTWQRMDSASKSLLIDKAKYFAVKLSDIDAVQSKPKLVDGIMAEAAYAIADTIDTDLASLYAYAGNSVSAATVSAGNVLNNLAAMQLKLDEANVPTVGRFAIVPPWYASHLMLAVTGAGSTTGVPKVTSDGTIVNGYVTSLMGFDILISNNVNNNGTVYNVMGLTRAAISHAAQLAKIDTVPIEDGFDIGLKGLYLYGSKVVQSKAMVYCAATRG